MSIIIDKRIQRFVEGYEYDDCISIRLKDIDETFWFDDVHEVREFLNRQAIERVGNSELRSYAINASGKGLQKYIIYISYSSFSFCV